MMMMMMMMWSLCGLDELQENHANSETSNQNAALTSAASSSWTCSLTMASHVGNVTAMASQCPHCPRQYASRQKLNWHIRRAHANAAADELVLIEEQPSSSANFVAASDCPADGRVGEFFDKAVPPAAEFGIATQFLAVNELASEGAAAHLVSIQQSAHAQSAVPVINLSTDNYALVPSQPPGYMLIQLNPLQPEQLQ